MTDHGEASGPVTVAVTRRIRAGMAAQAENWLHGVTRAALAFDGHLGAEIIRPAPGQPPDYTLIFRFDTLAHLRAWESSGERADWLARADAFTDGATRMQMQTGLEYWFTPPAGYAPAPPPRWRMAFVTWLGITPLVLVVGPLVQGAFAALLPGLHSDILRTMATTAVMIPLMTWLVMPLLTRALRRWLFRAP
jgi:hypothetical protein